MAGASLEIMESVYMSAVYCGSEIHINIDREILRLNRPENLVASTEKPHSIHETETKLCQIQNCMDKYPCKLINFLFYEKCLRPSYKIMQFTFQKTCYWSNKDDIFDVPHQSCMAPWTRQLIPADIWSQTLYSCDPRSRFLWVLDLGNWTGSFRPI